MKPARPPPRNQKRRLSRPPGPEPHRAETHVRTCRSGRDARAPVTSDRLMAYRDRRGRRFRSREAALTTTAGRLRRDRRARRRLASSSASRSSASASMNSFTNVGCMMPSPGPAATLIACRALHRAEDRARPLIHSASTIMLPGRVVLLGRQGTRRFPSGPQQLYRQALGITERLATTASDYQRDLSVAPERLANLAADAGQPAQAEQQHRQAGILCQARAPGISSRTIAVSHSYARLRIARPWTRSPSPSNLGSPFSSLTIISMMRHAFGLLKQWAQVDSNHRPPACMTRSYRRWTWLDMARRGICQPCPSLDVAWRGLAWPGVCGRWLPVWLP